MTAIIYYTIDDMIELINNRHFQKIMAAADEITYNEKLKTYVVVLKKNIL